MKCLVVLFIVLLTGCSSVRFNGTKFYSSSGVLPMITNDKQYEETPTKILIGNDSAWYIYTKRF
jgi:uncharacterized protein YceK